jgi:hypothetical protein
MICDKYRGKNTGPQCVNWLDTFRTDYVDGWLYKLQDQLGQTAKDKNLQ